MAAESFFLSHLLLFFRSAAELLSTDVEADVAPLRQRFTLHVERIVLVVFGLRTMSLLQGTLSGINPFYL